MGSLARSLARARAPRARTRCGLHDNKGGGSDGEAEASGGPAGRGGEVRAARSPASRRGAAVFARSRHGGAAFAPAASAAAEPANARPF